MPLSKQIVLSIVGLFLVVSLLMNIFLRTDFLIQSLNFIYNFQQLRTPGADVIQNLFSLLVNTFFLVALLAVLFLTYSRKVLIIIFISNFILNTYLMTIFKACFQEVRPFWYSSNIGIYEWTCPRQFGNPSGHSWLVTLMYQPFFTDIVWVGRCHIVKYSIVVALMILVPISRMYLGAHSGNQVTMGLMYGIGMCIVYRYYLQEAFYGLYEKLANKTNAAKWLFIIIFANIVLFIVPIVIFAVTSAGPNLPADQLMNLQNGCGGSTPLDSITLNLQNSQMTTAALIQIIFGALYAVYMSSQDNLKYLYGKWKFNNVDNIYSCQGFIKFCGHLLVVIVVGGLPGGVFALLIPLGVSNLYGKYILISIGILLASFTVIRYTSTVCSKLAIIEYIEPNHPQKLKMFSDNLN